MLFRRTVVTNPSSIMISSATRARVDIRCDLAHFTNFADGFRSDMLRA